MRNFDLLGLLGLIGLAGTLSCDGEAPATGACGEAECAEICATAAAPTGDVITLSAFEAEILGPTLEELRAGIRPFDEQGLGICRKGKGRDCGEFLGTDPGELPPGEHMLFAALSVPDVGEEGTWTVDLVVECDTDAAAGISSRDRVTSYDVRFGGKGRPYRLAPLVNISSPGDAPKACSWVMTFKGPTGETTHEGGWSVPGA